MIFLYEGINIQGNGGVNPSATFTSDPYPMLDVIDCTVTEERNGQFSLLMSYPIGAQYWEKIIPDAVIMASPRPNADVEPFRIYEIRQVIDGIVTARANHLVYDLDGLSIGAPQQTFDGLQGITAILNQLDISGQFVTRCFEIANDGIVDTTTTLDFGNIKYCSIWKTIGIIAAAFNAEMKYTWNTSTNRCTIAFCAARGTAKPTIISYGVNLVRLDRKLDYSKLYSRVVATWFNPDPNAVPTYWQGYANTGYTGRVRSLWLDVTDDFPSIPTTEELDAAAQAYIDSHDFNPLSDLTVDFVPLENTTENKYVPLPKLTDNAPYVKRNSGGALDLGIRNRETDKVVGGTVAWNQLVQNGNFASTSGWSAQGGSRTVASNECTLTATGNNPRIYRSFVTDPNHVYLFSAFITPSVATAYCDIYLYSSAEQLSSGTNSIPASERKQVTAIMKPDFATTRLYVRPMRSGGVSGYTFVIDSVIGIDLTATFGSLIADYVYTLESGTAGAGIAWLKNYGFFAEDYYSYNTATLESVNASAHVMRDASDNIIGNYALDSDLVLRGIPKMDANNNLYYDGDVYESNGTVTRKYGIRAYTSGDATDGSTMITDGTNTVYKLSTPSIESATPFTNPQSVYPTGTEQYVDASYAAGTRDFEMPVGHETSYFVIYADSSLYLCDTATVDASLIGVSATAKCVKVVYNVLTEKYDNVTVGTVQDDIVDTIIKLGE